MVLILGSAACLFLAGRACATVYPLREHVLLFVACSECGCVVKGTDNLPPGIVIHHWSCVASFHAAWERGYGHVRQW